MHKINFSKNWNNKLSCPFFTTIRPKDETYYKIGATYAIILQGEIIFYAEICDLQHRWLRDLTELETRSDAALSKPEFLQFFRSTYQGKFNENKQMVSIICLKQLRNQRDMARQATTSQA